MSIMCTAAVLLVLGGIGGFWLSRVCADYRAVMRGLELERMRLMDRLSSAELERDRLRDAQEQLECRVGVLRDELQDSAQVTVAPAKGRPAPRTPAEWLVSVEKLTPENLRKAEEYRRGTRTELSMEEVLILLDMVSAQDVRAAKAMFSGPAAG
ncbi:hypothetical protein GGQ74_002288 [Desulfobaculum xiamenense]|uniref:Uncharacterized protein n=1 Tax=Desulfobaculum xiamenense TaxID=995050 RepID=A0A846QT30_9BACT|nr:hypothetical protein [Desulfobaculum xiamenense]NJB68615.1 hypothetical protein [Desulfobaculum xiamenense]